MKWMSISAVGDWCASSSIKAIGVQAITPWACFGVGDNLLQFFHQEQRDDRADFDQMRWDSSPSQGHQASQVGEVVLKPRRGAGDLGEVGEGLEDQPSVTAATAFGIALHQSFGHAPAFVDRGAHKAGDVLAVVFHR